MNIAMICAAFPSHLATFDALARALAARGHRLSLVQRPDLAAWLPSDTPLRHIAAGGGPEPLSHVVARAAHPSFPFGVRRVVRDMAAATTALCRDAPAALEHVGADALVADQMEPAGALVAHRLGLPFVSLASGLPIEPEPALPLPMLPWRYDPTERGIGRNGGGRRIADLILAPLHATIAAQSNGSRRRLEDCLSPCASLWQLVPGLDFPRAERPATSNYVGPLRTGTAGRQRLDIPLDGRRPVVYASLGTLQGHRLGLFRRIARACRRIGAELVVSHCGRLSPDRAARIDADHVAADLPQRAMIGRADLVVTHGGLNTVLDTAEAGRPMLVLPIAFDQPGVAARVEHGGAGLMLDHRLASAGRIARALETLLGDDRFAAASRRIGAEIAAAPGPDGAAALVDAALGRTPLRGHAA